MRCADLSGLRLQMNLGKTRLCRRAGTMAAGSCHMKREKTLHQANQKQSTHSAAGPISTASHPRASSGVCLLFMGTHTSSNNPETFVLLFGTFLPNYILWLEKKMLR